MVPRARSKQLMLNDLDLPKLETAQEAFPAFEKNWREELHKDKPSLVRALRQTFWHQLVIAGIWLLLWATLLMILTFVLVRRIILYAEVRIRLPLYHLKNVFLIHLCAAA